MNYIYSVRLFLENLLCINKNNKNINAKIPLEIESLVYSFFNSFTSFSRRWFSFHSEFNNQSSFLSSVLLYIPMFIVDVFHRIYLFFLFMIFMITIIIIRIIANMVVITKGALLIIMLLITSPISICLTSFKGISKITNKRFIYIKSTFTIDGKTIELL